MYSSTAIEEISIPSSLFILWVYKGNIVSRHYIIDKLQSELKQNSVLSLGVLGKILDSKHLWAFVFLFAEMGITAPTS